MVMTLDPKTSSLPGRRSGDGLVMAVDRSDAFRTAARRSRLVRMLRVVCPALVVLLLGAYGLTIARTAGVVSEEALPGLAMRKVLPEDLSMKNPRYEGFNKDGGNYVFTAKTAKQDLTLRNVVNLDGIVGEVYQADKSRTDITAKRGVFNNEKGILDLYEQINVDSENGLKARLTRATILTKEDLLTSPEPVVVEFPNGSVRAKQMTLRQKLREATFTEDVLVELTPPPDDKPQTTAEAAATDSAPAPDETASASLFTPAGGPINIDANRLDISDGSKIALFTGNVRARQGDANLTTPELEVSYEGEGMMAAPGPKPEGAKPDAQAGKVRRIVAKRPVVMRRANGDVVTSDSADFDAQTEKAILTGEVIMTSGTDRRASSERVEIDEVSGTILLVGDVVVTQGGNELRGGRLQIERSRGTAQLTSPPGDAAGPGRIAARLVRNADGNPSTAKKDAASKPSGNGNPIDLTSFTTSPGAPVDVVADSLDVDDQRKRALFRGDVEATQDSFRIRCVELAAFYKGEAGLMEAANPGAEPKQRDGQKTELTRIEARKDVRVTSKDGQTATGDWADFDAKANKITMGGNVVLSRGKNMVRGTRLLIDMTTGESRIDTAPQNTVSEPSGGGWATNAPAEPAAEAQGRASAVFFPKDMKEQEEGRGKKKAKAAADPAIDGWTATAEPHPAAAPAN